MTQKKAAFKASLTFEQEQQLLQDTASSLLLFIHQRKEAFSIRKLSGQLPISSESVLAILKLYDLLGHDHLALSEQVEGKLQQCIQVCQYHRQLKGSDSQHYYQSSKANHLTCLNCQAPYSGNAKSIFCSTKCRVAYHRANKSKLQ